jgi:hypothetical protein
MSEPSLDIDDPQHWRDAAAEIRRIIAEAATAETKRAMSRIAEQYEHLAERTAHKGELYDTQNVRRAEKT